MSTESPNPTFEQLDILAHVEIDRFCDHCAYNLRGQPVRREPSTRLILTRCPECGSYHPANTAATALSPWGQRIAVIVWGGWLLFCIYLLGMSIGGQFAAMGATVDELGRSENRFDLYYSYNRQLTVNRKAMEESWARDRVILRVMSIAGSFAIGLVSVMIWTVIFPHWRRWGYRAIAIGGPGLGALGVATLVLLGEMRWLSEDVILMLVAMFVAHVVGGYLGSVIGRPVARGMLTLFLPLRQRATFAYLWMVDGKKPPHAAPSR